MSDLPPKPPPAATSAPRSFRRGGARGATRKPNGRPYRRNDNKENTGDTATDQPTDQKTEPPAAPPTNPEPVATSAATPAPTTEPRQPPKNKRFGKSKREDKQTQPKRDEKETHVPNPLPIPQQSPALPSLTIQPPADSASSVDGSRSSRPPRGGSRGGRRNFSGRYNDRRGYDKQKAPVRDEPPAQPADDETSSSSSAFSVPTPINSPSMRHQGPSTSARPDLAKPIVQEIDYQAWAEPANDDPSWASAPDNSLFTAHPKSTGPTPTTYQLPGLATPPVPSPRTSNASPAPPAPQPLQPPIDDSPTQIRRVGLCHVLLGPGAIVQHVFTDAESPWIVISNLPRWARKPDVQNLARKFGPTRVVKVFDARADTHWLPTARVLYEQHEQAKLAASSLHGSTLGKNQLTVRLDTDRMEGTGYIRGLTDSTGVAPSIEQDQNAVVKSCTVKVTWFAPTASVYVTYQSHRFAYDRIKELNGRTFGNRRIQMKPVFSERDNLAKVGRENGGYVVRIDGLWANVHTDELGRFLRSQDLVVQPNYSSEAGLTKLREDLSDVAPLESFRLMKHRRDDRKLTALAQYTTPTAAAAAVKVFKDRRGDYLGNSPIFVSRHLMIKYMIPSKLCRVLQGEINKLHSWSMDDPDINVRQADNIHKAGYVQITISGNETQLVASAKSQIDRALAGQPLEDDDKAKIWDPYFLSENWTAFSTEIEQKTKVCVRVDQRTCSLLLFGPDYARDEAAKLMKAELERLNGLRRVLIIPQQVFRRLANGGLTILRNLVGKGNIFINYFRQSLTFYGDDEVVRRVKVALDVMYSEVGSRLHRQSDCVVCLCQPEDSILLHCGHHYCKACFTQYVASAAESRTLPLVCVGRECKTNIPLSMITLHAAQTDQDALFYSTFQAYVAARPKEYRYCPTPDCQYIYRVGQPDSSIQCRLCLVHICTHCHVEHHEGISCEDYMGSHSEIEIQRSFDKWRSQHDVKPCPKCSVNIEKDAGCNHMMCSVCRTHICWVCLSVFNTGDEVYAHMRGRHGGIGL
ncbi:cell surface glycoprotein 1 [Ceratobasidium sp. AG-Ba]|nr:cell surface glycoprotein 1 [Ceratobasidium sp. AG-Ba]